MRSEFNVHFDFSGLVTDDQMPMFGRADISNQVYRATFNITDMSTSVSSKMNISDQGDINLSIPSLSLNLQPGNIEIGFNRTD